MLSVLGVALAMSRDGSSGGVIRMACITKDGVERFVLTGKDIPKVFEAYWGLKYLRLIEDIILLTHLFHM